VATQDPVRQRAIVVTDKAERVYYFHANTLHALADLVGAAGLQKPGDITPKHLMVRNADGQARTLALSIDTLSTGQLLPGEAGTQPLPSPFAEFWHASQSGHWGVPAGDSPLPA
jgi:hypothetical protein